MEKEIINLNSKIAPSFYPLHHAIKTNQYTHYWIKGGRGSTKSSFISIEIILGIMKNSDANAVVLRKVGETLKDSVFSQLLWAAEVLGVENLWKEKLSPLELIFIPTGQKIVFRGGDKPRKIKSTKFKNGYCRFIWFEEVDEFIGSEEIRIINQSLMRGGDEFCVFYSYNPPKSQRSWVNKEVLGKNKDKFVHHSTYMDVPRQWLGNQFFIEAEILKEEKPKEYANEYLGEVTGTGAQVFSNVEIREISDEEIGSFEYINRGLDWGYAADPLHYVVNYYNSKKRELYIFHELQGVGISNREAAKYILGENKENGVVFCDSAEPKSVDELCSYGIKAISAKKGPGSVSYGIKWLQDLNKIIIDPIRCPASAEEFYSYELESDGNGGFLPQFPDKNNHSIDATRYSILGIRGKNSSKKKEHYNFTFEKKEINPLKGKSFIL